MAYHPPQHILENYAHVLVNYALGSGRGIKKNEVVFLQVPESAKPLLIELNKAVLKSGAHPIIQYLPDEMMKDFFLNADSNQVKFFPSTYLKGKLEQADHILSIIAETNKHELEGVDPLKIMEHDLAFKPYKEWREEKENQQKFTWTLGLYGTPAMAKEAGLTEEECWNQIIRACFLNKTDPLSQWRSTQKEVDRLRSKLNSLNIKKINIKSHNTNLTIGVGEQRQWLGGGGRNIPSFELFISPDWRQTEGSVYFDLPLYRYGNLIEGIFLEFKSGRVVEAKDRKGQKMLRQMIRALNADKVGEFSLTDKRFSKINKFMAETLYDENFGGDHGNFHIALGSAYKESYAGDILNLSSGGWDQLGFNQSAVHTDIISTKNRRVTATCNGGNKILLYKNGTFQI